MANPNRAPAGTPTGGQFVAGSSRESLAKLAPAAESAQVYRAVGAKGDRPPEIASRLAELAVGTPVRIKQDGRWIEAQVTRAFRRGDGLGFGSLDHGSVSVGFGPGRWNTEVSGARIADGYVELEIGEPAR